MSFKTKALGLVAAAALSLSIASGAMAQASNTDSAQGSATLQESNCSIELNTANVSFGTWKWDGESYVLNSGSGTNTTSIGATVENGKPGGKCDVSWTFAGLTNGTDTIPVSNFSTSVSIPGTYTNQNPGTGAVNLTLVSVPNTYAPDTYTGTLGVSVVNVP